MYPLFLMIENLQAPGEKDNLTFYKLVDQGTKPHRALASLTEYWEANRAPWGAPLCRSAVLPAPTSRLGNP